MINGRSFLPAASAMLAASARSGTVARASTLCVAESGPASVALLCKLCPSHPAEESPSPMDAGTATVRAVFFKNCAIRSRTSFSFMVWFLIPFWRGQCQLGKQERGQNPESQ